MPIYEAEFHTDAEWASLEIEADTPQQALAKAHAVDTDTLLFEAYDQYQPVNQIIIQDSDRNGLAEWQAEDLRLQLAARQMFEALEYFFDITHDYKSSLRKGYVKLALEKARAAIAKAKGGAAMPAHTPGPWYVQESDHPGTGLLVKPVPGRVVAECDPVPEMKANARLIAAAPEIFAFIRQIARMTTDGEPVNDENGAYYDFVMENDDAVSTLNQLIEEARDLEAKAKEGAGESNTTSLPPDPDGKNSDRAEWAASTIRHFQCMTGTDWEDAVADLLCNLMHFCDRESFDFGKELRRARRHYQAETTEGGAA